MSLVLVNRLVMNLRRTGKLDNINDTVYTTALPSFAEPEDSILGNIGAPLRSGTERYDDQDIQDQSSSEVRSEE